MGLWNKWFGTGRDNDQIEAPLVDLESLPGSDLDLLEMELESTKNALVIADKECDELAARLTKTEKALYYLHLSGQRPVVPANRELEDFICDVAVRVSVMDGGETHKMLDQVIAQHREQVAARRDAQ